MGGKGGFKTTNKISIVKVVIYRREKSLDISMAISECPQAYVINENNA